MHDKKPMPLLVSPNALFSLEWNRELNTFSIKHISDLYLSNMAEFVEGVNYGNCTLGLFESEAEAKAWIDTVSKDRRLLEVPIDLNFSVLEGDPVNNKLTISTLEFVLRENNIAQGVNHDRCWKILGIFLTRDAAENFKNIIEFHRPTSK